MCKHNLELQECIIKDNEFLWYQKKFMERVDQYKQQVISNNE